MKFWKHNSHTGAVPKKNDEQLTIRDRLSALRNLPKFFKLVWQTSPGLTLVNALLRITQSGLPLAMLYTGKLIIDQVVLLTRSGNENLSNSYLWQLVALEFGLAVLSEAFTRVITLIDTLLGELVANHTSVKIMAHAATLDLEQFEDSTFYDKIHRARKQTVGRTLLLSQVFTQVQELITMCFLSAGLIAFNPWLISLLIVAVVPAFIVEYYFNGKNYALIRSQTHGRRELEYLHFVGASDQTAKEVRIFDLTGFLIERFRKISNQFYNDYRRLELKRAIGGILLALLASAGFYAGYIYIILGVVKGTLSIGDLTFLAGSFMQLRSRLQGILIRFNSVSLGAIYLRDFFEFFEIKSKISISPNPRPFPKPIRYGFTFENVSFRYANSKHWANRHLNFTIRAGEKLALVGENGAGKTTLVKLLARLYEPTEGRILLDGYDLKEYDVAELRMQIGIIFQDYLRYQMTASHNIAVGNIKEKNNHDLIIKSAKQSLAHTIIEKLSNKYDQMLGRNFHNGVELSGGEWQKLALARAYMRDAQLLILDEPTAALDAKAEYEVFQRFADLTKDKSAVLISHRFSTVRMADRILVLERGELIEMGSHEELLEQDGRYAELFQLQAMGYR